MIPNVLYGDSAELIPSSGLMFAQYPVLLPSVRERSALLSRSRSDVWLFLAVFSLEPFLGAAACFPSCILPVCASIHPPAILSLTGAFL